MITHKDIRLFGIPSRVVLVAEFYEWERDGSYDDPIPADAAAKTLHRAAMRHEGR
jgi:hypothetical protein